MKPLWDAVVSNNTALFENIVSARGCDLVGAFRRGTFPPFSLAADAQISMNTLCVDTVAVLLRSIEPLFPEYAIRAGQALVVTLNDYLADRRALPR
jgi:hypothetical protein